MKQTLFAALLFLTASLAVATPVGPMNYQGRLLDNAGVPVTGSYNFVVRIYNDPVATEPANVLKYQETKNAVQVDDGVYSFKVGIGPKTGGDSLWDIDLWQGNLDDLYLEIVVGGETLTPRHQLTSAPHSFTSTLALHANTVGYLGGQSTDNMLVAICKSSKGVWLSIAGKCLGPGADFSVAAVGGSVVTIASLHSGTNFTGVDLTNANISGINFGAVTFDYAIFKNTTYNSNNIKSSCFLGASWDGAIDLNAGAAGSAAFTCSIQSMTVKNMNISKWGISGVSSHHYFSAAELSACPDSIPFNWGCYEQYPASGRYMMVGPLANLGAGSAIVGADGRFNASTNVPGLNISGSRFAGAVITVDFNNNYMDGVDLSGATFMGNQFLVNSALLNLNFNGARMDGVVFTGVGCCGNPNWSNWSLMDASLNDVVFLPAAGNIPNNFNFTGAQLSNVHFPEVTNFNFTNAVLDSVSLDVDPTAVVGKNPSINFNFTNAKLTGDLRLDLSANGTGCTGPTECRAQMPGVTIYNANFHFDPDNNTGLATDDGLSKVDFSNCTITRTEFAMQARRTSFTNCTFKEVVVKPTAIFTQANFTSVTGRDDQIWWEVGATCPSGTPPNNVVVTAGYSTVAGVGCNGKW